MQSAVESQNYKKADSVRQEMLPLEFERQTCLETLQKLERELIEFEEQECEILNTEGAFSEANQSEIMQLKKSEETKIDQYIRASTGDIRKAEELLAFKVKDHRQLLSQKKAFTE